MTTPEWQLERWQQRALSVWTIIGVLLLARGRGLRPIGKISGALVPFVIGLRADLLARVAGAGDWRRGD